MNPLSKRTYFLFLLSPFFSAPFVLKSVYERSKGSLFLVALLFGLLSYLYIPQVGNDKESYYVLYQQLRGVTFQEFLIYISIQKTDFVFYFLIYLFHVLEIPLHFLFFILTTITVGVWLIVLTRICKGRDFTKKEYFLFFCLIVTSFSLPGLLSGIRYYFALGICLYGFYISFYKAKHISGLLFALLATFTHFGVLIFFIILLFKSFWIAKNTLCKAFFVISFLAVFLPRSILLEFTSYVSPSSTYSEKAESYLGESEYLERSLSQGNFNNRIKYFLKTVWLYLAYIYIFSTWRKSSLSRNVFFILMGTCHLFFSAPTIYHRFLLIAQVFFLITFIDDWLEGLKFKKMGLLLLFVLGTNLLFNAVAMRDMLEKSYFNLQSTTSATLLLREDITTDDIE